MQFDGDGVAVCIIKIDSQLKCAGILDSPSRLRMQRDLTGNRHVDGYVDKWEEVVQWWQAITGM